MTDHFLPATAPLSPLSSVSLIDDDTPPPPPSESPSSPKDEQHVFSFASSPMNDSTASTVSPTTSVTAPAVPEVPPPPPTFDDDSDTEPNPFVVVSPITTPVIPTPSTTAATRTSVSPAGHPDLLALTAALSLPSATPSTISNAGQHQTASPRASISPPLGSLTGTDPVAIGNRSVSAPSIPATLEPVSVAGRASSTTTSIAARPSATLAAPATVAPHRLSAAAGPLSTPRRETKVDVELKSFASALLPHNFDIVSDQVESGAYSVKRIASFLRKFCTMEEEHARKIQTALAHESSKVMKLSDDHMKIVTSSWAEVQRQFEKLTRQISQTASRVMIDVVVPLQEFHTASEEKRKLLLAEERKASAEMAAARDAVVKGLMQCDKLVQSAKEVAEKEKKDAATKKKGAAAIFSRMTAAVTKSAKTLTDQSYDAAIRYQASISQANRRQTLYLDTDLPKIFNAMQTLEQSRLDVIKLRLTRFMTIQHEGQAARTEIIEAMGREISELSTERDMVTFIDDWVREHGPPLPSQPYVYGLQCTPDDIKSGRLEGSNPHSVFRTNLEQVMLIQKENYPTLDYPAILKVLIQSIKAQGGFQAEGIFRLSVSKTELDELQAQFEQGNYEIKASSPHAPAALLKAWLRSLTDPLVPPELYNEAIECAKDKDSPASKVLAIFNKLPPITRKVVEHLAWICQEISEKNQETTRMNMENLAIVFAPSLLRCPSEDPLVLLGNSKFETRFTVVLFKAVPKSH